MAISFDILPPDILYKIWGKLSAQEEKEQIRLLTKSTLRLHYSIVKVSCRICEFEDKLNEIAKPESNKKEFESTLRSVLCFFPLENIEELPFAKFSLDLNLRTLAFRQLISALNRLSSKLEKTEEGRERDYLLLEFGTLLRFLNIDGLMVLLRTIYEYQTTATSIVLRVDTANKGKAISDNEKMIKDILASATAYIDSARRVIKTYNDGKIVVSKCIDRHE